MSEPETTQPMNSTNNPETNVSPAVITCAGGCNHTNPVMLRSVMYAPLVLVAGAFAAVAMFPELAEYATPLIGKSGKYSDSAMTGNCSQQSSGPCCYSQGSCPASSDSQPITSETPATSETNVIEADMAMSDAPADALAAANVVEAESIDVPAVETN